VRGTDDPIYLKLLSSFAKLNPSYGIEIPDEIDLGIEDRNDDLLPVLRKKVFLKDFPTAVGSATSRVPVSLLVIDLDHFKVVNDNHGHAVGDEVLIDCAKVISGRCNGKGEVYRYGGEEIVVLLQNFTATEAVALAELIRADIEASPAGSVGAAITASIGIATAPDDAVDSDELFKAGDRALYEAKNGGRNCVRTAKGISKTP
jgi:diguanylate cyclase (GGDEF)-like protein